MIRNLVRFDWAVKRLLRNKANYVILEGFLSELLGQDIHIEQVLESEGNRTTADDKTNRVDLLVRDHLGELIIVEIQNNFQQDYLLRMLYGTSKLITDHMDKGMGYGEVKKVISVNVVYFDLGTGEDYVYRGATQYIGLHKKDILKLSASEEKVYHTPDIDKIYPEYYIIKVNQFNDVAKDTLDEWINFFKNQEVKEGTQAKGLREAGQELAVMKLTDQERADYDGYIRDVRDRHAEIVGNYNKGLFEGEERGVKKEKLQMARNMLIEGIAPATIARITGLDVHIINTILKEM